MDLEKYVGKVYRVKIIEQKGNWYIAKILDTEQLAYIEDTKDFAPEELIGQIEKCLIMQIKENQLIGVLLNNRKFINDLKILGIKRVPVNIMTCKGVKSGAIDHEFIPNK